MGHLQRDILLRLEQKEVSDDRRSHPLLNQGPLVRVLPHHRGWLSSRDPDQAHGRKARHDRRVGKEPDQQPDAAGPQEAKSRHLHLKQHDPGGDVHQHPRKAK